MFFVVLSSNFYVSLVSSQLMMIFDKMINFTKNKNLIENYFTRQISEILSRSSLEFQRCQSKMSQHEGMWSQSKQRVAKLEKPENIFSQCCSYPCHPITTERRRSDRDRSRKYSFPFLFFFFLSMNDLCLAMLHFTSLICSLLSLIIVDDHQEHSRVRISTALTAQFSSVCVIQISVSNGTLK